MAEHDESSLENAHSADINVLRRRSRRFTGKDVGVDELNQSDLNVLSGPELVTPTMPMPEVTKRSEKNRTKLLDVAEFLFARWGYTGVSIRDVADLSKTRLGSVNYYFGNKQNLYYAVWKRRAEVLCDKRLTAMQQVIDSDLEGLDFIEELVDSYVLPAVELNIHGGAGWRNFFQMLGHVTFSRLWPKQVLQYFNDPAEKIIEGLKTRFPDMTDFHGQSIALMLAGPMLYLLSRNGRIESFSNPTFTSDNIEALEPEARRFMVGGICGCLGMNHSVE